jgi:hypothetical protein
MASAGGVVGVDPRLAVPVNLLNRNNWNAATAGIDRARTQNPDNRPLVSIDRRLHEFNYPSDYQNFESGRALQTLDEVRSSIVQWQVLNPSANTRFFRPASNARRTDRYNTAHEQVARLLDEVNQHVALWVGHPAPSADMAREYMSAAGIWGRNHPRFQPQEGMGTDNYASILELVTPGGAGYEPETAPGRANIIAAVQEAATFAAALEAAPATNHFDRRVRLSTVAGVNNVTNPNIHVGNPRQPNQTTNASIQATMAIDLAQIASFIKSTVAAAMNPQQLFALKHHSDLVGAMGLPQPRRAETEMARAPLVAQRIIRNHLAVVPGWGGNVTHLRGLLTLVCQYLMMGKHFFHPDAQPLDKNIVPLLSRNDLGAVLFHELVPPAEQALVATATLRMPVIAAILTECGSGGAPLTGGGAVFNDANDTTAPTGAAPYDLSRDQFITNVLSGQPDGITGNLGGFRQFPDGEGIDPRGARGGDYRRGGVAHREGAIFELRNMVPSDALTNDLNLTTDRFPRTQWVIVATHICNLLAALNALTMAQSAVDTRYRQATGLLHNELSPW